MKRWNQSSVLAYFPAGLIALCLFAIFSFGFSFGILHAVETKDPGKLSGERSVALEEKWGIRPLNLRLTGEDRFLVFRYLVLDAEKARPVLSRGKKAFLVDRQNGRLLSVPMTKVGQMRSNTQAPKKDRQYFVMFANEKKIVAKGRRVTLVIGDLKIEDLVVE